MNIYKLRFNIGLICAFILLLGGAVTTLAQTDAVATVTPSKSDTPVPSETPPFTPTMTATPTPQGTLFVLQISAANDDVNESNGTFDANQPTVWAGNGDTTKGQYLGLRFDKAAIPANSIIHAAHLEVYSSSDQWISLSYNMASEATDNSKPFTVEDPPSKRKLTTALITHESNTRWLANILYPLDDMGAIVQEVVSRPGWQMGNSLSIIVVGTEGTEEGGKFGRKFFTAFETDPKLAARLVIDISPGTLPPTPAASTVPTHTLTPVPTLTPTLGPTVDVCDAISLPTRLKIGQTGQVVTNASAPSTPLNIRKMPDSDAERIGRLAPGVLFMVIDGPVCTDDVAWFKVRYGDNNMEGWLSEGQDDTYFVKPVK